MKILRVIRMLANVDIKLISEMLNVSTYAYLGFESGDRSIPEEILPMIAKIYDIDETVLYLTELDEDTVAKLIVIGNMGEYEKKEYLACNLLGENAKISYRNVNKIKNIIKKQVKEINSQDTT